MWDREPFHSYLIEKKKRVIFIFLDSTGSIPCFYQKKYLFIFSRSRRLTFFKQWGRNSGIPHFVTCIWINSNPFIKEFYQIIDSKQMFLPLFDWMKTGDFEVKSVKITKTRIFVDVWRFLNSEASILACLTWGPVFEWIQILL